MCSQGIQQSKNEEIKSKIQEYSTCIIHHQINVDSFSPLLLSSSQSESISLSSAAKLCGSAWFRVKA
jgi:hypothetical protein